MEQHPSSPVGVRLTGVDLHDRSADLVAELEALLAEHGVAVIPDQDLDDDAFTAFLRQFGDLVFTTGETPVPGHPDLNVISNVGLTRTPRSTFHVDTSYLACPPAYTALRTVEVPEVGGQTLFTNQYRAAQTLPEDLRAAVEGRTLRHVVTGVEASPHEEASAEHPLLRRHPLSGRESLYLTTPSRCGAVSGLDADASAALVARLHEHSTADDNVLRHAWAPGDVVVWDNGCVLHKADHSGVVGDRVMHRGMATGYTTAGR